tara:strand:+ start:1142 stop:1498 length:357 start_codon:yes stop_codon:yes gene_type:complete
LLSKYFSRAKENKNKEKTEINRDGISVNNEKKIIYFLLAIEPLTLILFLIEFFVSKKIIIKKANNKKIFANNRYFKFWSVNLIKLLSINVKKVIKVTIKVKKNKDIINRFLFKKVNIN